MARIRIVDEWLRSPVASPTRYRTIMVVADSWGEQRVLMRAFAESDDQTRPTILLHGAELAIGPAGPDPHGPWGIHVEPPGDGRAQELRAQLELAARRLAGSRGSPPRLQDEAAEFERKRTGHWAPGAPRDVPGGRGRYWEPVEASRPVPAAGPAHALPTMAPYGGEAARPDHGPPPPRPTPRPTPLPAPAVGPGDRAARAGADTPVGRRRRRGWTSPLPPQPAPEIGARDGHPGSGRPGARTVAGFASGGSAEPEPAPNAAPARVEPRRLGSLVTRTMPMGFRLSEPERLVLNTLGEVAFLTARKVGEIANVQDPVAWMEQLMMRLSEHGLDLVAPGDDLHGEPTYVLRR